MGQEFKLLWPFQSSKGVLSPDDLCFFYYGVGLDTLEGIPSIYEDNNEIQEFIKERHLNLDSKEPSDLPTKFEDGHVYWLEGNCDNSKYDALFRHLRNAFAHYHIRHDGNYYFINDYNKNGKMTMIGKIACQDLKDLISIFYTQRNDIENSMSNHEL